MGKKDLNKYLGYSLNIIEKCIGEEPPYCQAACPLHIDNRKMISLIRERKYHEALKVVLKKLPFPKILGRVCVRPCEKACKRGELDEAVSICHLKRFIANKISPTPVDISIEEEKDKKVAIVGSGPAGLMAAYCLRKKGYKVTIFEAEPFIGGALRLFIPSYRLPRKIVDEELDFIPEMGIEIKLNTALGKDISLKELRKNYDAVFLALGTQKSLKLGIRGESLDGVIYSIDLLRKANTGQEVKIDERVAVIGGGNLAIDAARTALRLGAKDIKILYRRTKQEMPAHEIEVKDAEEEGVKLEVLTAPIEIIGKEKVESIKCIKTELGSPDKTGRRRPIPVDGSEFELPVDQVIVAIGLTADLNGLVEEGIKTTKYNTIEVNPETLETSIKGVFAGGDVVNGPDIIVNALSNGRQVAYAIDTYLQYGEAQPIPYELRPWETNLVVDVSNVKRSERRRISGIAPEIRVQDFHEVHYNFDENEALAEAERCLQCECRRCVRTCPFLENYCFTPQDLVLKFQYLKKEELNIPYSCHICSLCEALCPQGLNIGKLCMEYREKLVNLGLAPLPEHKSVLSNQKWGTSKYFTVALPDIETGKCKRVFFPGCALPGYSPEIVIRVYEYLRKVLPDTGIVLNCCGAPTHLLGDMDGFKNIQEQTKKMFFDLGTDEVILACPNCYRTFKDFAPELKLTTVYHIMAEKGVPEPASKEDMVFSIHDSCVTRYEEDLQESVREIIKALGYQVEELEYSRSITKCCGAGDIAFHGNRSLAVETMKIRAEESLYDYITYCADCKFTFAFVKKPVLHLLDLIYMPNLQETRLKAPLNPLSKKRNRWILKKKLKKIPIAHNKTI